MSQYQQGESIYTLIPEPLRQEERAPMHRSKYPHDTPPTGSTFGASTAAQILATNVAGNYEPQNLVHPHKLTGGSLGPKSVHSSDTTKFLKRKQKNGSLPSPQAFRYGDKRKPAVVKRTEAPSLKPRQSKNYIAENAVSNITAEPKVPESREIRYVTKPEYGKKPAYLEAVKQEISAEKDYIREIVQKEREEQMRSQPKMRLLPEEERERLLTNLKRKWEVVNKQYQEMTHIVALDTIGKVRRKEEYETQLQQIEKSIEKLSKKYVFVHDEASQ